MKFHNPFDSTDYFPGFFAILSIVIIVIIAVGLYPPLLFGFLLFPIIYTIRYILKGNKRVN